MIVGNVKSVVLMAFLTFLLHPAKCMEPQNEVIILIIEGTVQIVRYLKDIRVVYTKDEVSKPDDSVEEVEGLSADINAEFGGDHVWLVPVWTTDVSEGVTSIEVIVQDDENPEYADLAKRAGGSFRYLKMMRNSTAKTRIVEVKLYRTGSEDSKPPKFGYKNYSGDINAGRKGDFLYVCWKNVDV